ncbi:MAG: hypothetical protein QOC92_4299 [Acidimicrobiaceae bacterium]|jgi:hypothetical protein
MGLLSRILRRDRRPGVIDIRDDVELDDEAARHRDYYPDDCPVCGGAGYLDHIDLTTREQRQHCRQCGRIWSSSIR